MLKNSRLLGRSGQKLCEKFLKNKGYKLLARNFLCKTGEIDLVMADAEGAIVFVEVKTRTNEDFVDAEAAITKAKQIRMNRAAKFFITTHKLEHLPMRFDVVIVMAYEKHKPKIRHYENAF
ncbi:MAG: YraN family protein [Phycisphaerae bacterium]|nr:YraN family protein [Phycisphaerae bacterium]